MHQSLKHCTCRNCYYCKIWFGLHQDVQIYTAFQSKLCVIMFSGDAYRRIQVAFRWISDLIVTGTLYCSISAVGYWSYSWLPVQQRSSTFESRLRLLRNIGQFTQSRCEWQVAFKRNSSSSSQTGCNMALIVARATSSDIGTALPILLMTLRKLAVVPSCWGEYETGNWKKKFWNSCTFSGKLFWGTRMYLKHFQTSNSRYVKEHYYAFSI